MPDDAEESYVSTDLTPEYDVERDPRRLLPSGKFSRMPIFDTRTVQELAYSLGELWDFDYTLNRYNSLRRKVGLCALLVILATIAALIYVVFFLRDQQFFLPNFGDDIRLIAVSGAGLVVACLLYVVVLITKVPIAWAEWRFFRHMGIAIDSVRNLHGYHWGRSDDESVLRALDNAGRAARVLFIDLQRRRRTWSSLPSVGDRAFRLVAPMIDVELPNALAFDFPVRLMRFLHDVSAVVAIGRVDLIPRVRSEHEALPRVSSSNHSDQDREKIYLNPMHNRSRWDVIKDFWYPLAPWLSMLVALTALAFSILR